MARQGGQQVLLRSCIMKLKCVKGQTSLVCKNQGTTPIGMQSGCYMCMGITKEGLPASTCADAGAVLSHAGGDGQLVKPSPTPG